MTDDDLVPYVVLDRRQSGELREIARFREPVDAIAARDVLRRHGDRTAEVAIAGAIDPLAVA
jgi:hypothetical protein